MQIISEQRDVVRGARSLQSGKDATKLLSLYNEAPQEELTLDEFELFALDRLNLMRRVEDFKVRGFEGEELTRRMKEVSFLPSEGDENWWHPRTTHSSTFHFFYLLSHTFFTFPGPKQVHALAH